MAIEAKKYPTPLIYKGDAVTFPTFASQVFLDDGTPLLKDGELDANTLGGVSADEYALKSDAVFSGWSDDEKAALLDYVMASVFESVAMAKGVSF